MKITRRQLRRIILRETRMLLESTFQDAIDKSKKAGDKEVYFYDPEDRLIHVLKNGVVEDTINNVEPGSKKYTRIQGVGPDRAINFA